ncbi:MAG: hypothetical protein RL685_7500 [Pseudomonadota bacterium]|jgi:uncharacterized circularly permuted ATP-grasp superfamily protein
MLVRAMHFNGYDPENGPFFDELFRAPGRPRSGLEALVSGIDGLAEGDLKARQRAAEHSLLNLGITFTLNGDGGADGSERIFPFDIIPRVINAQEWQRLERGIKQRLEALNLFLADVYGERRIVREGIVPEYLLQTCADYRPQCKGLKPPQGIWCHVSGTDLVRHKDGEYYVLEDNLRCPSGVSYVLENRELVKRTFPGLFEQLSIRLVYDYPMRLLETLRFLAQDRVDDPRVVVLTPGRYNSAYYEHCFLAQQMGVELVESQDLVVDGGYVQMKTTRGLERVDVIYRRIGDDYLDPKAFRPESLLGIPGVMQVYLDQKVALANAPGTGVADDKAVYAYVEKMIRFYLSEEPLLKNVPTYVCSEEDQRRYVLDHLEELVVKATDGAGGYGMLVGPHSTAEERRDFHGRITKNPRGYIAQPTLSLSRVPTIIEDRFEPRHVDLRPFALHGREIYVQPGGLTRVALKRGSLVVNSSQGGGSKDTWVLAE